MKKEILIGSAIGTTLVIIIGFVLILLSSLGNEAKNNQNDFDLTQNQNAPAEKIEIIHFHAAQQCWSCITVGNYTLKTIQEKFPEEYQSGKITFTDINVESPENKNVVLKFRAAGSSLFINTIRDGKDNISEEVTVWRLVNNEKQFIDYFENKIKSLLGK